LAAGVDEQPDNANAIDTEQHATTSLIGLPLFLLPSWNLGGECGIFAVLLSLQLYADVPHVLVLLANHLRRIIQEQAGNLLLA
jgi:hypothetical protein